MTKLFLLSPEVAGGWGPLTSARNGSGARPTVEKLDYQFQGWLGDELLETHPCFIVTEALAKSLLGARLTGFTLQDVIVSASEEFLELYGNRELPRFHRLVPAGYVQVRDRKVLTWSGEDICNAEDASLVVTERCLHVLRSHALQHCEMVELTMGAEGGGPK